jgi:hypothetical protein
MISIMMNGAELPLKVEEIISLSNID